VAIAGVGFADVPNPDPSDQDRIADVYREFAREEAAGRSPRYEEFCLGVADDEELLARLAGLPRQKTQPNLVLAAARWVGGLAPDYTTFRHTVLTRWDEVLATLLQRRTQTNEPARSAAFYPLLAALPQPIALIEVGASAGLCLYPDRYRLDYGDTVAGDPDSPLTIACTVQGDGPTPGELHIAWRAGIDLNPLDVRNDLDVRWLETLIWPGDDQRLERLRAAVAIARQDPPHLVTGDLVEQLPALAASAPPDATVVVLHTAVFTYVPRPARAAFVELVSTVGHWLAQEWPGAVPGVDAPRPAPPFSFLLSHDGQPVAFTGAHGGWIHWLT
jgi:hypothetical protein